MPDFFARMVNGAVLIPIHAFSQGKQVYDLPPWAAHGVVGAFGVLIS